MWDRDFLDKWDMVRRIEARLFCFGSGDSDDGGSSNVDTSNPNEMRSREQDQAFFEGSRRAIVEPQGGDPAKALSAVTGISPTLVELAQSATPAQRAANAAENDRIFNEFFASDMMNRPADISVASTNLPPAIINDFGVAFDTTTGNIIAPLGDPYDELSSGMVPLNRAPVPTPPPPRFQTNAEKDFYENLAAQGDAAMNQFRSEVRNLDNRGLLGDFIARGIGNRGVPNFNPDMPQGSQIRGVTNTRFVDLPFVGTVPVSTYTGLDNPNAMAEERNEETVPPVINPLTGRSQCPDGYVFDEDLQACRLDTSTSFDQAAQPEGDMFFRRTSLDTAPANTPSGFEFDAANTRFVQSYGNRPDFYRSPMSLTGFTRLS